MTSPLLAVQRGDDRYYQLDGNEYLSVTTIIGAALPKPFLLPWAVRLCYDATARDLPRDDCLNASNAVRDESARIGNLVHGHAEFIMLNPEIRVAMLDEYVSSIKEAKVRRRVESFAQWVHDFDPQPVLVEATVFSDTYGYAGSCDLFAELPAHPDMGVVCIDYKTSKSLHPEVSMQTAAYAKADFGVTDEGVEYFLPIVGAGAVLHIKPNSYDFRRLDIDAAFKPFLNLLITKRDWLDSLSESAILGPIKP